MNQLTGENDSESFSSSGGSNIAPRAKASLTVPFFDQQFQNKRKTEASMRSDLDPEFQDIKEEPERSAISTFKSGEYADASDEVNQRDLQAKRDQEERDRMADVINHWAAGKEGNLLALLSTLQYVLWPECGWQPISQADLISGDSVKKVYRKAILCIHPDKVQQKGANLQQKYVSEKVFYPLKEAWEKL